MWCARSLIIIGGVLQLAGYAVLGYGLWKLRRRKQKVYLPLIGQSAHTLPEPVDAIGRQIAEVADARDRGDRYLLDWIEQLHRALVGKPAWLSLGCIVVGIAISTVGAVLALNG